MKVDIMQDIVETTRAFMKYVINEDEALDYDVLMKRLDNVVCETTEHGDDTIDIDYKHMCFTVHLNTVLGQWQLCENASYYIMKHGFLDTVNGVIDVELF